MAENKKTALSAEDTQKLAEYEKIMGPEAYKDFLAYMDKNGVVPQSPSIPSVVGGVAMTGLEGVAKAADAPGVPIRIAAAKAMGVHRPEDLKEYATTLKSYPGFGELMARAGVPEGGKLSDLQNSKLPLPAPLRILSHLYQEPGTSTWLPEKGGMLDPTVRGGFGTALDMGTNPATYATGGLNFLSRVPIVGKYIAPVVKGMKSNASTALEMQAAKAAQTGQLPSMLSNLGMVVRAGTIGNPAPNASVLSRAGTAAKALTNSAINPIGNATEYLGSRLYASGVLPLDKAVVATGKEPISTDLLREGVWGTSAGIQEQMTARSELLRGMAEKIAAQMESAGIRISAEEAMQYAEEALNNLNLKTGALRPEQKEVYQAMSGKVGEHKALGDIYPSDAVQLKSDLYNTMPDTEFEKATRMSTGSKIRGEMARGYKDAMEQGANLIDENGKIIIAPGVQGQGEFLRDINNQWGKLLTAKDAAANMAGKTPPHLVSGNTIRAATGAGSNLAEGLTPYGLAATAWRSTPVKTTGGWLMNRFGRGSPSAWSDAWLRSKFIEDQREPSAEQNLKSIGRTK